MEQIFCIVCAPSESNIGRRSNIGIGKFVIFYTWCWDGWKNSRLYCSSHQTVWNLSLRQIVHLRQIWQASSIMHVYVVVPAKDIVKRGASGLWAAAVGQTELVATHLITRVTHMIHIQVGQLGCTLDRSWTRNIFWKWRCRHLMRLMMVYHRISKSAILVSYKLKPTWEVATWGRWTLFVVNLDRMMNSSSVTRFVHVVISYWYSQVIVWNRVCIPGKCGRAFFFNLKRPHPSRVVLHTPETSIKIV